MYTNTFQVFSVRPVVPSLLRLGDDVRKALSAVPAWGGGGGGASDACQPRVIHQETKPPVFLFSVNNLAETIDYFNTYL